MYILSVISFIYSINICRAQNQVKALDINSKVETLQYYRETQQFPQRANSLLKRRNFQQNQIQFERPPASTS